MRARIVYTRPDGGVSVCIPADECVQTLASGTAWQDMPRGFLDIQIERQVVAGHFEWAAARFARAVAFGGLTAQEAVEAIRDRDCAHLGTGHEIWDVGYLPQDRWFRNAWARSHNGGPINIDLGKARRIQFTRIKEAAAAEEKRRQADIDLFDRPVDLPWGSIRDRIHAASDVADLRRIWPEGLS